MAQIISGIKRILSFPSFYNIVQNILGADIARKAFISKYCKLETGQRWLDIGCGTAELLKCLPDDIHYVGYDISAQYIKFAKETYKERNAEFYQELITEKTFIKSKNFDRVVATGLLHHLEDSEVIYIFNIVKSLLNFDGQFISIDPCYISDQAFISKFLIDRDRGQNVRDIDKYHKLALNVFEQVELIHCNNLLRIPYDHTILICQ